MINLFDNLFMSSPTFSASSSSAHEDCDDSLSELQALLETCEDPIAACLNKENQANHARKVHARPFINATSTQVLDATSHTNFNHNIATPTTIDIYSNASMSPNLINSAIHIGQCNFESREKNKPPTATSTTKENRDDPMNCAVRETHFFPFQQAQHPPEHSIGGAYNSFLQQNLQVAQQHQQQHQYYQQHPSQQTLHMMDQPTVAIRPASTFLDSLVAQLLDEGNDNAADTMFYDSTNSLFNPLLDEMTVSHCSYGIDNLQHHEQMQFEHGDIPTATPVEESKPGASDLNYENLTFSLKLVEGFIPTGMGARSVLEEAPGGSDVTKCIRKQVVQLIIGSSAKDLQVLKGDSSHEDSVENESDEVRMMKLQVMKAKVKDFKVQVKVTGYDKNTKQRYELDKGSVIASSKLQFNQETMCYQAAFDSLLVKYASRMNGHSLTLRFELARRPINSRSNAPFSDLLYQLDSAEFRTRTKRGKQSMLKKYRLQRVLAFTCLQQFNFSYIFAMLTEQDAKWRRDIAETREAIEMNSCSPSIGLTTGGLLIKMLGQGFTQTNSSTVSMSLIIGAASNASSPTSATNASAFASNSLAQIVPRVLFELKPSQQAMNSRVHHGIQEQQEQQHNKGASETYQDHEIALRNCSSPFGLQQQQQYHAQEPISVLAPLVQVHSSNMLIVETPRVPVPGTYEVVILLSTSRSGGASTPSPSSAVPSTPFSNASPQLQVHSETSAVQQQKDKVYTGTNFTFVAPDNRAGLLQFIRATCMQHRTSRHAILPLHQQERQEQQMNQAPILTLLNRTGDEHQIPQHDPQSLDEPNSRKRSRPLENKGTIEKESSKKQRSPKTPKEQ